MPPGQQGIIFEFVRVGSIVKVTAVDTRTGIEAAIVGPPHAGETTLKRLAERKLLYVMRKQGLAV